MFVGKQSKDGQTLSERDSTIHLILTWLDIFKLKDCLENYNGA